MYQVGDVTNDHRFTFETRNEKYFTDEYRNRVLDFQNLNKAWEKKYIHNNEKPLVND